MCGTFNVYITEYQLVFEFDSIIHEQRNKQYKPFENKIILYLKKTLNFSTIKAIFHKTTLNVRFFTLNNTYMF